MSPGERINIPTRFQVDSELRFSQAPGSSAIFTQGHHFLLYHKALSCINSQWLPLGLLNQVAAAERPKIYKYAKEPGADVMAHALMACFCGDGWKFKFFKLEKERNNGSLPRLPIDNPLSYPSLPFFFHCCSPIAELDFKATFGIMACFLEWKAAPFGCKTMKFKMTNAVIAADASQQLFAAAKWSPSMSVINPIDIPSSSGFFW